MEGGHPAESQGHIPERAAAAGTCRMSPVPALQPADSKRLTASGPAQEEQRKLLIKEKKNLKSFRCLVALRDKTD